MTYKMVHILWLVQMEFTPVMNHFGVHQQVTWDHPFEVDQTPVVSFSWEVLGCLYTQPIELNQGDRCSRLQFDHTKVKCKSLQGIVS